MNRIQSSSGYDGVISGEVVTIREGKNKNIIETAKEDK